MLAVLMMTGSESEQDRFTELFDRYGGLMLHVANQVLHSHADAEDAVQDAFLSLLKIIGRIPEPDSPKAKALCVITARNKAIDLLRRRKEIPTDGEEFFPAPAVPDTTEPSDEGRLAAAMARLPERYRDLLLLRYDLGYSTKELALLTDTDRGTIQKTIFRARKALEKELESL